MKLARYLTAAVTITNITTMITSAAAVMNMNIITTVMNAATRIATATMVTVIRLIPAGAAASP
jgi:hypothetical protein